MFILIIVINNIFKFNTLNLIIWLFFTYANKDQNVYFYPSIINILNKKKPIDYQFHYQNNFCTYQFISLFLG